MVDDTWGYETEGGAVMRFSPVVVVLGALVASAAVAASAAAATEPAFFECAKLKSGGEFTDKNCSSPGPGRFVLREGIGRKHQFKMKSSSGIEVVTEAFEMICGKTSVGGEDTSPTTVASVYIKMSGCEQEAEQCTSSGEKSGVVLLGPLSGSLGYTDKEATEVGVDLAGEGGHPLGEFGCNRSHTPEYRLNGSIIGLRRGDINVVSKQFTLAFGAVSSFEGGEPDVPTLLDLGTSEEEAATFAAGFRGSGERLKVKA